MYAVSFFLLTLKMASDITLRLAVGHCLTKSNVANVCDVMVLIPVESVKV